MTSMLCCLGSLGHTILIVTIMACIVALLIATIKSPHMLPFFIGFVFFLWGVLGCYSIIKMSLFYSTHSSTVGELVEHDPYEDFNFFEYKITDFGLEQDKENKTFFYQKTYATSVEFDGTEGNYILLMNNKPCDKTSSQYGKLYGNTIIHFDDVDGAYKCGIELDFTFTFYANHIVLKIDTNATQENASLLTEYIAINGLNLRILSNVYSSYPILSDTAS